MKLQRCWPSSPSVINTIVPFTVSLIDFKMCLFLHNICDLKKRYKSAKIFFAISQDSAFSTVLPCSFKIWCG